MISSIDMSSYPLSAIKRNVASIICCFVHSPDLYFVIGNLLSCEGYHFPLGYYHKILPIKNPPDLPGHRPLINPTRGNCAAANPIEKSKGIQTEEPNRSASRIIRLGLLSSHFRRKADRAVPPSAERSPVK